MYFSQKSQGEYKINSAFNYKSKTPIDFPEFIHRYRQRVEFVNYVYNHEFSEEKLVPVLNLDASKKEFNVSVSAFTLCV